MGMYDTYGDIQLKVGDMQMQAFQIGDVVPIDDGVYVARNGVVVIVGGRFVAQFTNLKSKWGDILQPEDAIESVDYIKQQIQNIKQQYSAL